ncbi:chemotaxis protein CheX [Acidobacteria bacterium AB60]|nr:chemotaxis protein CheX [Acidobacteria bacterium AB60]
MIDQISLSDITGFTHEIWSTMAGTELTLSGDEVSINKASGYVVASVQIVGDLQHVVRLDLDASLVMQAASSLLGVPASDLSHEDMRDAAGELANMTGGCVKALLPEPRSLTLPSVVVGTDYEFAVPQGCGVLECSFASDFGNMKLCILERRQ